MNRRAFVVSVGLAGAIAAGAANAGQHEGHQAGAAAPSATQVNDCRQAQPVITGLLNAALKRLEDARLTNSAAAMRDAADDVQSALVDMRTQLAPCSVMQAAAAAVPAAQAMPATPATQPGSTGAAPAPASHAGHTTPAAPSSRTPAASAARPSTSARPAPPANDAHAGHAPSPASSSPATPSAGGAARATKAAPPTSIADLKCSNAVDQRTAPRMLYQGRMYYFCTEASRAEFAKDPAKFVTAPPQAAPAHAH